MQITCLHNNIYRLYTYAKRQESHQELKKQYKDAIEKFEKLERDGAQNDTKKACGAISRATYFRYKKKLALLEEKGIAPPTRRPHKTREKTITQKHKDLVLKLRQENPTYGKFKIATIIKRDHEDLAISESSVGRILKNLTERGKIQRSLSAKPMKKLPRKFDKHAKRWKYGQRAAKPGELVQIDHMSVWHNGKLFKHFQACDPTTKVVIARAYSCATSTCAKDFLRRVQASSLFPIRSIQVDGGSEFMQHFEAECQAQHIDLFVLPPKSPKHNGCVERTNRTFREEFYANTSSIADTCCSLNEELDQAVHKYNTYRPHQALRGATPYDYYRSITKEAA